jgi:hypothetical protein
MGTLAGQPNYFITKIWMSIPCLGEEKKEIHEMYGDQHVHKFNSYWDVSDDPISQKLHTIRAGNRWKAGMKIHPVINNRTKDRFQFAPEFECVSVQEIRIEEMLMTASNSCYQHPDGRIRVVYVDDHRLYKEDIQKLAINDGFDSLTDFFNYFNEDFKGQIIHWTDLRY